MFSGYEWIWKSRTTLKKDAFSLPCPLPQWPSSPQVGGFGSGMINIGEIEIAMVKDLKYIRSYFPHNIFFKPAVSIPDGFYMFGHFGQTTNLKQLTTGYLLVARAAPRNPNTTTTPPPLSFPLYYTLCLFDGFVCIWKPHPPDGYQAMGFMVTTSLLDVPQLDQVVCVRDDLVIPVHYFPTNNSLLPSIINLTHKVLTTPCLRNFNTNLEAIMPNLEQLEALIHHYGPTVYFHPDELYLPSSVPWFFNTQQEEEVVKRGCLESAELYVHVKPALGGTFTDIDMWIFFPCKGPQVFTALMLDINITRQHVGHHWEHFTLRVNNFDGQLWRVYFSGSGGWVDVGNLEFTQGTNKPVVYSSRSGHQTFPNAGTSIQGYPKLRIGMKKDVQKSHRFIDSSKKYQIIRAGYLGAVVPEPSWLKYMHECGHLSLKG